MLLLDSSGIYPIATVGRMVFMHWIVNYLKGGKKMKTIVTVVLLAVAIYLIGSPQNRTILALEDKQFCKEGIEGPWSFSAHPFLGEGYESRPIVVTATKTEAETLTVSEVRIRNISSKPASSLKLGWNLSVSNGDILTPLKEGITTLIPLTPQLQSGETTLLKIPVFSFTEFTESLPKDSQLKGKYKTVIFVQEITFTDKSKWRVGDEVKVKNQESDPVIVNASYSENLTSLFVSPLRKSVCPKQFCDYVSDPTSPGYTCKSSQNDDYCTNCVTSCCNTICSDTTPSCSGCN